MVLRDQSGVVHGASGEKHHLKPGRRSILTPSEAPPPPPPVTTVRARPETNVPTCLVDGRSHPSNCTTHRWVASFELPWMLHLNRDNKSSSESDTPQVDVNIAHMGKDGTHGVSGSDQPTFFHHGIHPSSPTKSTAHGPPHPLQAS